jgi:hypothetical protein
LKSINKLPTIFRESSHAGSETDIDNLVATEKTELITQAVGVVYGVFIIGITIAILLELKTEYQIDLFPGINTPFDDVYREAKGAINGESQP